MTKYNIHIIVCYCGLIHHLQCWCLCWDSAEAIYASNENNAPSWGINYLSHPRFICPNWANFNIVPGGCYFFTSMAFLEYTIVLICSLNIGGKLLVHFRALINSVDWKQIFNTYVNVFLVSGCRMLGTGIQHSVNPVMPHCIELPR